MVKSIWHNVHADGTISVGPERIPRPREVRAAFESAVRESGWEFVEWTRSEAAPFQCLLRHSGKDVDVVVYLKAISNAGWERKPHCKRVQVSNLALVEQAFLRPESAKKINLILGYYCYEQPLFVAWEADHYVHHNTNRSAYVDADQLAFAYSEGSYRGECSGLPVEIFSPGKLGDYLGFRREQTKQTFKKPGVSIEKVREIGRAAAAALANDAVVRRVWDGEFTVEVMREGGSRHWRQMEWPGFFFEFCSMAALKAAGLGFVEGIVAYGNTTFDLFCLIPWDLKVHSRNGKSKEILANSSEAISGAIEDYGYVGFIVLHGDAVKDEDGTFREWHEDFKGGESGFTINRKVRGKSSRPRKRGFIPYKVQVLVVDVVAARTLGVFQETMRNAGGSSRTQKRTIDVTKLPPEAIVAECIVQLVDY